MRLCPPRLPCDALAVHTETFDTLWHRGGVVDDSLLLFPHSMAVDDSIVYVFDRGATRIVAFAVESGEVRWAFGRRGGGPGEFKVPEESETL